jgi:hypothetical protein
MDNKVGNRRMKRRGCGVGSPALVPLSRRDVEKWSPVGQMPRVCGVYDQSQRVERDRILVIRPQGQRHPRGQHPTPASIPNPWRGRVYP